MRINTRFANKLYVNKQQRDGLNINDLLRLPVNIYWKNKYGFYLGCNDTMAEVAHINLRNDVIGTKIGNYVNKDCAETIEHVDRLIMKAGNMRLNIEYADLLTRSLVDALYYLYISIKQPLYNVEGKIIGMFGFSISFKQFNLIGYKLFKHLLSGPQLQKINQGIINHTFTQYEEISSLTNREKQCLFYLSRGRTIKEIAKVLKISPKTVEYYWENIKIKSNCNLKSEIIDKYMLFTLLND